MTGTVKFFDRNDGYGLIESSDSKLSIAVYQSGVHSDIGKNDQVTFDVEGGEELGFHAVNVEVIRRASKRQ